METPACIWGDGNKLTKIVEKGDTTPVGSIYDFYRTSATSAAIDGDKVAFFARFGPPEDPDRDGGIFTSSGGTPTLVVKTGDVGPFGPITILSEPFMAGGWLAFFANYPGGSAIFATNGGPLRTVFMTGDSLFGDLRDGVPRKVTIDPTGSGKIAFRYNRNWSQIPGIAIATPVPEPPISAMAILAVVSANCLTLGRRRRQLERLLGRPCVCRSRQPSIWFGVLMHKRLN